MKSLATLALLATSALATPINPRESAPYKAYCIKDQSDNIALVYAEFSAPCYLDAPAGKKLSWYRASHFDPKKWWVTYRDDVGGRAEPYCLTAFQWIYDNCVRKTKRGGVYEVNGVTYRVTPNFTPPQD